MPPSSPRRNIVLYADDDPEDLDLVLDAFRPYSSHVEVLTVNDGIQALQFVQRYDEPIPCLLILDINMPILNGKEVLKKIRDMERCQTLPVVLFSTSSLPQDEAFAKEFKAGFVTKPLDVYQMQGITEVLIDHLADDIKKSIRRGFQ